MATRGDFFRAYNAWLVLLPLPRPSAGLARCVEGKNHLPVVATLSELAYQMLASRLRDLHSWMCTLDSSGCCGPVMSHSRYLTFYR